LALRHRFQATRTDCGLAAVAIAAGQSLRHVRNIAVSEFGYPPNGPYYTGHKQLRQLLAWFGIEASGLRKFTSYDRLDDVAILLIKRNPDSGGHYVVFERPKRGPARVLDPGWWLKQHVRTNLARIPVAYYATLKYPEPQTPQRASKRHPP